ncbi:MAG: 50S ribosomal protein L35 [Bacilli bacterium]|nr:50S ribosomal protein L35 [Bacilli bacterium]
MKSYKIKTKSGFKKRFKSTATGKLKRACAYTGHLAHRKTRKQRKRLRKYRFVSKSDMKREKYLIQ